MPLKLLCGASAHFRHVQHVEDWVIFVIRRIVVRELLLKLGYWITGVAAGNECLAEPHNTLASILVEVRDLVVDQVLLLPIFAGASICA